MIGTLVTIGLSLIALFVSGLIFSLVVKLTVSVGRYIKEKMNKLKRRIAVSRMREILEELTRNKKNEEQNKNADEMSAELGEDALVVWAQDENQEVIEDSIEVIEGNRVDNKTREIMDKYNGYVTISPYPVG